MKRTLTALGVAAAMIVGLTVGVAAGIASAGPTVKTVTASHTTYDGTAGRIAVTKLRAAWRPAGHGDGIDGTPTVTVTEHRAFRDDLYCATIQGPERFGDHGNNWTDTLRFRYLDAAYPFPCKTRIGFTVVAHIKLDADGNSTVTWKDYSNDPGNPVGHADTKFGLTAAQVKPLDQRGHGSGPIGYCHWWNFTYVSAGVLTHATTAESAWVCPNGSRLVGGVVWDNREHKAGWHYVYCSGPTSVQVHVRWPNGVEAVSWLGDWFYRHNNTSCDQHDGVHIRMAITVYGSGGYAFHFWSFQTTICGRECGIAGPLATVARSEGKARVVLAA
jgi:hypothetical protein